MRLGTEQVWQEGDRLAYLMPITFEGSHVGYSYLSIELIDGGGDGQR